MKFSIKKITFLFYLFFTISANSLSAQNTSRIYLDPKYGHDSLSRIECAANLSTISEFMKLDLFDYALPSWRKVFNDCPGSSRNIYLYGVRIYRSVIEKEKKSERQQELIDTLMLIYDRRIENFGQEGLVLGRKGTDLLKYRPDAIPEVYSYLEKSVMLSGKNTEDDVLVKFMQTSVVQFRKGKIQGQEVIENYLVITDILNQKIASGEKGQAGTALKNVESIFSESGIESCTDLINYFTPKYNQDSTARSAYYLARLFIKRGNFSKAVDFLNKAVELSKDPEEKSACLYQLALVESTKSDQYVSSRSHAIEAARLKPDWGDPYILIGKLYAASREICNENELQQSSVFWVAVDQFEKAKKVDPSKTAEVDDLIISYSQYFPNAEDAFFYGLQKGQEYKVGCWINEKTRVRTRSN
jgi:tetratricopeptide (TPR) repeat protein